MLQKNPPHHKSIILQGHGKQQMQRPASTMYSLEWYKKPKKTTLIQKSIKISCTHTSSSATGQLLLKSLLPFFEALIMCSLLWRTSGQPCPSQLLIPPVSFEPTPVLPQHALSRSGNGSSWKTHGGGKKVVVKVGLQLQTSSRHTNISMCLGEVKQKHYFWQEPAYMPYLSNCATTDFNKGDVEQQEVIC